MITRRTALMGAATAATAAVIRPILAEARDAPASEPTEGASLARQKIDLTVPPLVHKHE